MPQNIKFKQCANCGWSDLPSEFTLNWCDECAKAFIKGAVAAFAAGVGTFMFGLLMRASGTFSR